LCNHMIWPGLKPELNQNVKPCSNYYRMIDHIDEVFDRAADV
jgi:hypothetical protein